MSNDRLIISSLIKQKQADMAAEMAESKYFELFSAIEILKDHDLSYDELNSGLIGAGNDGGIDSIFIFLNSELVREDSEASLLSKKRKNSLDLHIIQSKKTAGFSEEAMNKIISSTDEIFDLSVSLDALGRSYNKELVGAIEKFRQVYEQVVATFPELSFSYYYVTLGDEVHPNIAKKADRLRQSIVRLFDNAQFKFSFIGARELLRLARKEPFTSYELEFTENPISTETGSYVCLVPLGNYYKFITDDKGGVKKHLFDANVRDYQGDVIVNEAIQGTLKKPGKEDFWFLNNGVTIVCPKASASGKKIIIEDPQIVNGLQTSYEIHAHFSRQRQEHAESRKILVRVIVEQDAAARDNIVRATNSQTSIPKTSGSSGICVVRPNILWLNAQIGDTPPDQDRGVEID
ncbi:MAG: AIPR family protein, partial [Blastocatellia bacterium]|nr:AIPR family protein [Blastocatellia bacterium]